MLPSLKTYTPRSIYISRQSSCCFFPISSPIKPASKRHSPSRSDQPNSTHQPIPHQTTTNHAMCFIVTRYHPECHHKCIGTAGPTQRWEYCSAQNNNRRSTILQPCGIWVEHKGENVQRKICDRCIWYRLTKDGVWGGRSVAEDLGVDYNQFMSLHFAGWRPAS